MIKQMLMLSVLVCLAPLAQAQSASWLTISDAAYRHLRAAKVLGVASARQRLASETVHLVKVSAADIAAISRQLHAHLKHCGGFMAHSSEASARAALTGRGRRSLALASTPSYTLANAALVEPVLAQMDEANIGQSIVTLSGYPDRGADSAHGAAASDWLAGHWRELGAAHDGITVEQRAHAGYGQASVIATIQGSERAAEVVVVGAHLDSINIFGAKRDALAPGADDDASGVAGLTEVLRVLAAHDYRPLRTIRLIAYAAEEVGLRGSQDIAGQYKRAGVDVVGVLQLDMTNYRGSAKDIYLISDYTSAAQNRFLAKLIQAYLPGVTVGADRCGYACSDHAAWDAHGYATSMPFESLMADDNPHIHTVRDTYANSGQQAGHALKFARLAAAYAIELGSEILPFP